MSVTMICPHCERKIKIKFELIGRRVKCSKCKEGFDVPEKLAENIPPAPEGAEPALPEKPDDRKQEKPKRRTRWHKKKEKKNRALIIGGAIGALVLLATLVPLIIFVGIDTTKKGTNSEQQAASQSNKESRAEGAGRFVPIDQSKSDLKQIHKALELWYKDEQRGPKDYSELIKNLQNKAHFDKVFSTNQITVIWKVPKKNYDEESNHVIAFETAPDRKGIRLILRNYGDTEELDQMEFQAALKANAD